MERFGRWVARHAWLIIGVWVGVFLVAGAYGSSAIEHLSTEGGYNEQADSYTAYRLYAEHFQGSAPDITVLYSSESMTVDDPRFVAAVDEVLAGLPTDQVRVATNGLQAPPEAGMVSDDRHAVQVFLTVGDGDVAEVVNQFRGYREDLVADSPGIDTDVAGTIAMGTEVLDLTERDSVRAEVIALPIVFVLSLFIFRGLPAALMPPVVGMIAVTVSLAAMRFVSTFTTVASTTMMIVTLLGLGLAIDYTLFVVSRFREELGAGRGRAAAVEAMGPTVAHAGRTVIFSALVVSVAMASLLVFPIDTVRSMAYGSIPAVLTAMAAAVTLLPAVLAVLAHRINALQLRRRTDVEDDTAGVWAHIGRAVMRRPWAYLVGVSALLIALGLPALGAHWGSIDLTQLPRDSQARSAQDRVDHYFGGGRVTAWTIYEGDPAQVPAYSAALTERGVDAVTPLGTVQRVGQQPLSFLYYTWPGSTQSPESHDLVRDLRQIEVPDGSRAFVGGDTATSVDQVQVLGERLPWMVLVVVVSMLVLLGAAFRSVVLPVKAVIVSAISILASFGVVTWVFQDGHLSGLLGFEAPGYVEIVSVLVMGAILFGLSMDYEVFLLSRVHEEYLRTGDNTSAVVHGLARTGRIITGAALLLAVVIGGFVTSSVVFMKMIGLGMLVAVLLDATVVRGLLVPAAMKLLGHWNWWPQRPAVPAGPGVEKVAVGSDAAG